MNYLHHFDSSRTVEACVAGVGDFGRGLLRQAQQMPSLSVRIAIDINAESAAKALSSCGIPQDRIMVCHNSDEAFSAWQEGLFIASGSLSDVLDLPFDILVESTGIPEAGARHAEAALLAGKHVGIATKETESVIGPWLTRLAQQHGRIFTPLDGDQPALLIGLISWAQTLGFEIIAAGKSSEYDFVWQPEPQSVLCNGTVYPATQLHDLWDLAEGNEVDIVHGRGQHLAAIPQISAPDLCEMTNVANATGLVPDRPDFHALVLRNHEVPTLLDTQARGGVLQGHGRLEVFNCLRQENELSFAGGVFVTVRCCSPDDWALLQGKGHVLSRSGQSAMIYLPRHLLGLEAPISLLDAVLKQLPSGGGRHTRPHVDLVARTTVDLEPQQHLEMRGHHRHIQGLRPEIHPAAALEDDAAVPFYLLPGAKVVRPIKAGQLITLADVALPDSHLKRLRHSQDQLFHGTASVASA